MSATHRWVPSRRWLFLPPILIGLLAVGLLAMSRKELNRVPIEEAAIPLRVMRAMNTEVSPTATGYGTARPLRVWTAVAEVGGRIVDTHTDLRSGVFVKAGEPLLKIDEQDYFLRQKQRRADLAQMQAQAEQLKLSQESDRQSLVLQEKLLGVRQADVDRLSRLRNTSAASASESDAAEASLLAQMQAVQTLKNTVSLYPARIASADAAIEIAESRLAEATRDVERTAIAAPFAGVLSGVMLEPDQYVMPAERLLEVHDVHSVEIEAQFSMSQLSRLIPTIEPSNDSRQTVASHVDSIHAAGLSAVVTTRSGDLTVQYAGQPVRVREAMDDQTRTLGIVVRVANREGPEQATLDGTAGDTGPAAKIAIADPPEMPLRPGTYCEVELVRRLKVRGIMIPRTAVSERALWVVDEQNRLRKRPVRVGFSLGDQVVIVEGIAEGQTVAIKPPSSLAQGRLVQPLFVEPGAENLLTSLEGTETRE